MEDGGGKGEGEGGTLTGSTVFCEPTVCETRSHTTSTASKPASLKRARIVSAVSDGRGTRLSGAAWESLDRPA